MAKGQLLVGVILAWALLAEGCSSPANTPQSDRSATRSKGPSIELVAPADGSTLARGSPVGIQAVVSDSAGIAWVQLWDDDRLVEGATPAITSTELTRYFFWIPDKTGSHTLKVMAANLQGEQGQAPPLTFFVIDTALQMTAVAAHLITATPTVTPLPSATPTITPTPSATPIPAATFTPFPAVTLTPTPFQAFYNTPVFGFVPTPIPVPGFMPTIIPDATCSDAAEFVGHVSIPDNTLVPPGAVFFKVWRLRNSGTCVWDGRYQLVTVGGTPLSARSALPVPQMVPPGGSLDLRVPMVAPPGKGVYLSQWQMRNPAGVNFGSILHVLIIVRGF